MNSHTTIWGLATLAGIWGLTLVPIVNDNQAVADAQRCAVEMTQFHDLPGATKDVTKDVATYEVMLVKNADNHIWRFRATHPVSWGICTFDRTDTGLVLNH